MLDARGAEADGDRAAQKEIYLARMAGVEKDAWASLQELGAAVHGPAFSAKEEAEEFFASAASERRAPDRSMRFYPPPFMVYLERWKDWLEEALLNLWMYEQRAVKEFSGAKKPKCAFAKTQLNKRYYNELSTMQGMGGTLDFFKTDQKAENLMLDKRLYLRVAQKEGLVCWCDICSDVLGSNSQCPFFLSTK